MIKIAQLSDLHLLEDPSAERWGLNPNALFERCLTAALKQQPDAVLLTGDLVHDESAEGYQRLAQRLQTSGITTLAIAGNHDNPDLIAQTFGDAHLVMNGLTVIGLNTHIRGSDCGFLGTEELERAQSLIAASNQPVLLALHHPPVAVGSEWIDELGLADAEQFSDLVETHQAQLVGIICGHVHQVFETTLHGVPLWTAPSTNRQFLPKAREFATDTLAPGYRWMELQDNLANPALSSTVTRCE